MNEEHLAQRGQLHFGDMNTIPKEATITQCLCHDQKKCKHVEKNTCIIKQTKKQEHKRRAHNMYTAQQLEKIILKF